MRMLPNTVIGLLEELEVDFPPKCKTPDESLDEHMLYAGHVSLVTLLRARYEAGLRKENKGLPKVLT